jgi:hypothetical protein
VEHGTHTRRHFRETFVVVNVDGRPVRRDEECRACWAGREKVYYSLIDAKLQHFIPFGARLFGRLL